MTQGFVDVRREACLDVVFSKLPQAGRGTSRAFEDFAWSAQIPQRTVTVGGQMYQKFGLLEDYWLATGSKEVEALKGRDMCRWHDTQKPEDKFIFKVPQLRNVAMTPPYFHDGSVQKLDDAVRVMARLQLGKQLSDEDVKHIVTFLNTLTGDVPKTFLSAPALPVASFSN